MGKVMSKRTKFNQEYIAENLSKAFEPVRDNGLIIGLDMSLGAFGVCAVNNKQDMAMNSLIKSKLRGVERLADIRSQLKILLEQNDIRFAVIESYAYGRNVGRFFEIGELGGVIKHLLFIRKIPFILISPLTLKKWITGSVKGDKSAILLQIYKRYNVELNDNNVGDAFVLAQIGCALNSLTLGTKQLEEYHKYQIECIKSFLNKIKEKEEHD
jgi:Holliday junction resolvasome RuvABC endonuclease subunit